MAIRRFNESSWNGSQTNNQVSGEGSNVANLTASSLPGQSWMQPLAAATGRQVAIGAVNATGGAGSASFNLATAYSCTDYVLGVVSGTDAIEIWMDTGAIYKGGVLIQAGIAKVFDSTDAIVGTGSATYATGDKIRIKSVIKNSASATTTVIIERYNGSTWVTADTITTSAGNWRAVNFLRIDRGLFAGFASIIPTDTNTYNAGSYYVEDTAHISTDYRVKLQLPLALGTFQEAGWVAGPLGVMLTDLASLDCKNGTNTGYAKNLTNAASSKLSTTMQPCGIATGTTIYAVRFLVPFVFTGTAATWSIATFGIINGSTYSCTATLASSIVANGVIDGDFHGRGLITDTWTPGTMNVAASSITPVMLDAAEVGCTLVSTSNANECRVDTFQLLTMYAYTAPSGGSRARGRGRGRGLLAA